MNEMNIKVKDMIRLCGYAGFVVCNEKGEEIVGYDTDFDEFVAKIDKVGEAKVEFVESKNNRVRIWIKDK